jgi:hypothetical protein
MKILLIRYPIIITITIYLTNILCNEVVHCMPERAEVIDESAPITTTVTTTTTTTTTQNNTIINESETEVVSSQVNLNDEYARQLMIDEIARNIAEETSDAKKTTKLAFIRRVLEENNIPAKVSVQAPLESPTERIYPEPTASYVGSFLLFVFLSGMIYLCVYGIPVALVMPPELYINVINPLAKVPYPLLQHILIYLNNNDE